MIGIELGTPTEARAWTGRSHSPARSVGDRRIGASTGIAPADRAALLVLRLARPRPALLLILDPALLVKRRRWTRRRGRCGRLGQHGNPRRPPQWNFPLEAVARRWSGLAALVRRCSLLFRLENRLSRANAWTAARGGAFRFPPGWLKSGTARRASKPCLLLRRGRGGGPDPRAAGRPGVPVFTVGVGNPGGFRPRIESRPRGSFGF